MDDTEVLHPYPALRDKRGLWHPNTTQPYTHALPSNYGAFAQSCLLILPILWYGK
jgi:hypothetical protein